MGIKEIDIILTKNIRKRREQLGYTQEYVAKTVGLSVGGYRDIERRNAWPSRKSIGLIAGVLEVPVPELYTDPETTYGSLIETLRSAASTIEGLQKSMEFLLRERETVVNETHFKGLTDSSLLEEIVSNASKLCRTDQETLLKVIHGLQEPSESLKKRVAANLSDSKDTK